MSDTAPCRGMCGRLIPPGGKTVYTIAGTSPYCAVCAREYGLTIPDAYVAATSPAPARPEPASPPAPTEEEADPTTTQLLSAVVSCNHTRLRVDRSETDAWFVTPIATDYEIPKSLRRGDAVRFRRGYDTEEEALAAARRIARVLDRLMTRIETAVTEAGALLVGLEDRSFTPRVPVDDQPHH